jgi:predicted lipoprotein with Yx(FWY)xxD motif
MNKLIAPFTATLFVAALALTGCASLPGAYDYGSGGSTQAPAQAPAPAASAPAAPSTPVPAAAESAALATSDSTLGTIVVDGTAMTVYRFDSDTKGSGTSACTGGCAAKWPAVIATSATPTVEGVTGTVGGNPLPDGTFQATVNGWPLYRFAKDVAPGDVLGQGVGDVWHVVAPDGSTIKDAAPQASGY